MLSLFWPAFALSRMLRSTFSKGLERVFFRFCWNSHLSDVTLGFKCKSGLRANAIKFTLMGSAQLLWNPTDLFFMKSLCFTWNSTTKQTEITKCNKIPRNTTTFP